MGELKAERPVTYFGEGLATMRQEREICQRLLLEHHDRVAFHRRQIAIYEVRMLDITRAIKLLEEAPPA